MEAVDPNHQSEALESHTAPLVRGAKPDDGDAEVELPRAGAVGVAGGGDTEGTRADPWAEGEEARGVGLEGGAGGGKVLQDFDEGPFLAVAVLCFGGLIGVGDGYIFIILY